MAGPARGRSTISRPEVFLTGGTGLVGSHIAEALRSKGRSVRALHRTGSDTTHLAELGCSLVEGDLGQRSQDLAGAMAGCGGVVHAAASVYASVPWDDLREINVEGSRRVFEAAAAAGIRRGVHLSSVAVYGRVSGPVEEPAAESPAEPPSSGYGRSKREAEAVVDGLARAVGMQVALLRPPVVYGERDRLFTPRLARTLRFPIHPIIGSGKTPIATVYAGNLAQAVVAALGADLPFGARPFNLSGDHPVGQRALLGGLARHLGISFRPVPIPSGLVGAGAWLGDRLGGRLPGLGELRLRRVVEVASRPDPYGSERARRELGWSPPFSLEEALARTASWIATEWKRGETSVE